MPEVKRAEPTPDEREMEKAPFDAFASAFTGSPASEGEEVMQEEPADEHTLKNQFKSRLTNLLLQKNQLLKISQTTLLASQRNLRQPMLMATAPLM